MAVCNPTSTSFFEMGSGKRLARSQANSFSPSFKGELGSPEKRVGEEEKEREKTGQRTERKGGNRQSSRAIVGPKREEKFPCFEIRNKAISSINQS